MFFKNKIMYLEKGVSKKMYAQNNSQLDLFHVDINVQILHKKNWVKKSFGTKKDFCTINFGSKEDLSLKCSAWKGCIPRLEWKSSSPKQILGSEKFLKKYGSKEVLGPPKILNLKNYWVQKFVNLKQFWGPKSLGSRMFEKKSFV